jgi:hypothetical protein
MQFILRKVTSLTRDVYSTNRESLDCFDRYTLIVGDCDSNQNFVHGRLLLSP